MPPLGDVLLTRTTPPQLPPPPEIEGYLKKLKRKTTNLTGSWNKRWFFVDPKRREFAYTSSKSVEGPRTSIYLNDITAVVQFDDTHFQVESRTRNFFLCGESKASTTCWVRSLDEYRKKLVEYDKARAVMATQQASRPIEAATVSTTSSSTSSTGSTRKKGSAESDKDKDKERGSRRAPKESGSSKALDRDDTPTSPPSAQARKASPVDSPPPRRHDRSARTGDASAGDSKDYKERSRDHDHDHDRERDRDRERGSTRGGPASSSASSTSSTSTTRRQQSSPSTHRAKPKRHGAAGTSSSTTTSSGVKCAWMDDQMDE